VILQSLGVITSHSPHDNAPDRRGQRAMNRKRRRWFTDGGFRRYEAACAPRDSTIGRHLRSRDFRRPRCQPSSVLPDCRLGQPLDFGAQLPRLGNLDTAWPHR
jgi:hypothetical protein